MSKEIIIFDVEPPKAKYIFAKRENLIIELLRDKNLYLDSTISTILIKPLLEYCMPVISELPEVIIMVMSIGIQKKIDTKQKIQGISYTTERPINCIYNNKIIKIAAGQLINIIALYISAAITHKENPLIQLNSNNLIGVYDYRASGYKYKLESFLRTGIYGHYNNYKNCYISNLLSNYNYKSNLIKLNTADINSTIKEVSIFCNNLFNLFNRIYPITLKSIHLAHEYIPLNDIFKAPIKKNIINWLIENKLIDPQEAKYINYTDINFIKIIEKINWHGLGTSQSKRYIDVLTAYMHNIVNNAVEETARRLNYADISKRKSLAYNKFGTTKLYSLNPSQQKTIADEYNKLYGKNINESNTHRIETELITAINSESKDYVEAIYKQIDSMLTTEMKTKLKKEYESSTPQHINYIKLKDSTEIICPHLLEHSNMILQDKLAEAIENNLANKYGEQTSEQRDTFCKICGALLVEYNEEDITFKDRGHYVMTIENDEIFSMVKIELQYVISQYMEQPKDAPISLRGNDGIIDMLAGLIRSKILDIQHTLLKIKTLGDNDMWILINIYIYIYIFAILTQFIFANPLIINYKRAKDTFIDSTRNIKRDHSNEVIKPEISDTTKKIDNENGTLVIGHGDTNLLKRSNVNERGDTNPLKRSNVNERGDTRQRLHRREKSKQNIKGGDNWNSSTHKYIGGSGHRSSTKKNITTTRRGGRQVEIKKNSKEILEQLLKSKHGKENLEKLINHSLEHIKKIKYADISKSKYITLANIRDLFLEAYKWTLSLNYNVESIEEMTHTGKQELPETNIQDYNILKFFEKYGTLGRTYEQIESDFSKSIPSYKTVKLKSDAPTSAQLLYTYIIDEKYNIKPIPSNVDNTDMINKFMQERNTTNKEYLKYRGQFSKPINPYPKYILDVPKPKLPFALVGSCTKDCNKTYAYIPKNSSDITKYIEYSKKDILNWLDTSNMAKLNELYRMKCLGTKCICKTSKPTKVINFYKYFEQYCPKGEIHIFESDKCKKCGINSEIIKTQNIDYFDKYKNIFFKTRIDETTLINHIIQRRVEYEKKLKQDYITLDKTNKYPEWTETNKNITELAKRINIKNLFNLFNSIGMYTNIDYKKIENNVLRPYIDAADSSYINQYLAVHNYILYIYKEYYLTKNSEYIIKLPPDIKTILSRSGQSNKDFAKKLTDLDMTYIDRYDWYTSAHTSSNLIANFCIDILGKTFIVIDDIFKKAGLEKFGQIWIQFYIAKIIALERSSCSVKLKDLKPLAKYENDADDKHSIEDNDELGDRGSEIHSDDDEDVDKEMNGAEEFANEDIDIGEQDDDEDNQDNTFITVD